MRHYMCGLIIRVEVLLVVHVMRATRIWDSPCRIKLLLIEFNLPSSFCILFHDHTEFCVPGGGHALQADLPDGVQSLS